MVQSVNPELIPPEHCGHSSTKLSLVQDWKSEQQDDNPCLPAQTWAPCADGCCLRWQSGVGEGASETNKIND